MRKTIIYSIIFFIAGAFLSPVVGMAIGETRNLILGLAPEEAILILADKIDEESIRNDAQQQQLTELEKNQTTAICQKSQEDCEKKINDLLYGEINVYHQGQLVRGDKDEVIQEMKSSIAGWEKGKKEVPSQKDLFEENIKKTQIKIANIKEIMAVNQKLINELLNDECKDYKNPCE
jgi:hypothetical protein